MKIHEKNWPQHIVIYDKKKKIIITKMVEIIAEYM